MCLKKTSRNRRFWFAFWRQIKIAGLKGVTCALATSCSTSSAGLRLTPSTLGGEEESIASLRNHLWSVNNSGTFITRRRDANEG
jgi:hypothetical protein